MTESAMKNNTEVDNIIEATAVSIHHSDNVAHALAGAGGGLMSMALTYPLITLSTRAQVESKRTNSFAVETIHRIVEREGISGLYAGLDSALFGISVTNFVYYYWYEWTRSALERLAHRSPRSSRRLTAGESMLAGAVAGCATVFITNPIWVINTRVNTRQKSNASSESPSASKHKMQEKRQKASTFRTLRALLKEESVISLFRGVVPALVLVINPILQYTIFEELKTLLEKRHRRVTPRDAFYLGAIGKLLATGITYPYITVKNRMYVAATSNQQGLIKAFRTIIKNEGWGGLYKGVGPKLMQSVLTAAFLFAFKDALYQLSLQMRHRISKRLHT